MKKLRKIIIGLITVSALLALAGYLSYKFWFPDYRPSLQDGEAYGVDVSHHQGEIDWEKVKADDVEFAYIKSTEGGDWQDSRFQENWENAKSARINVGAYHFFTLCTDAKVQAQNFIDTVDLDSSDLPPAIDIENGGNCANPPNERTIEEEVNEFIAIVESKTDKKVIAYVLEDFEFLDDSLEEKFVWKRSLLFRPQSGWDVWQYTGEANVDGINTNSDLNVFKTELVEN